MTGVFMTGIAIGVPRSRAILPGMTIIGDRVAGAVVVLECLSPVWLAVQAMFAVQAIAVVLRTAVLERLLRSSLEAAAIMATA